MLCSYLIALLFVEQQLFIVLHAILLDNYSTGSVLGNGLCLELRIWRGVVVADSFILLIGHNFDL